MQHLEVSCALRPIEWPLGVKWLMTVVRMLFFDVLNLTIFLKRGTSVSQFVSAGWWFVCFLAAHLSAVKEMW